MEEIPQTIPGNQVLLPADSRHFLGHRAAAADIQVLYRYPVWRGNSHER